jgi:hypothetical protein
MLSKFIFAIIGRTHHVEADVLAGPLLAEEAPDEPAAEPPREVKGLRV